MRYKKKPVLIEAVQYDKTNLEEVLNFAEGNACYSSNEGLIIATLEGNARQRRRLYYQRRKWRILSMQTGHICQNI